ncbi:MAG TPA: hypothetical protein VGB85_10850 [Nannocystis sp.]|jgi:hypothetical protein
MRITTPLLAACVVLAACNNKTDTKPNDGKVAETRTDAKPGTPTDTATPATPTAPTTATAGTGDKFIPADAALLAHIDMKGLSGSPLWASNKAMMDADPEVKKQMEAFSACNMPFDGFRTVDLGVGAEAKNIAVVAQGAGIGKPENLRCLSEKMKDGDWKLEEVAGGKPRLVFDNGEAYGYLVDDDTLAIATKAWDASVTSLMTGKGTSVRDGALKDVLAQADQTKHVWFAGNLPPQLAAMATAQPGMSGMAGLKSVAGSLDLTAGLGLVLAFGMENADRAKTSLAEVQKQFASVKPMAGMLGIPATAVDKVTFEAKDAAVTMTASLTMDEINAMSSAMKGAPGGAGAGAAGSTPTGTAPTDGSKIGTTNDKGAKPTPSTDM